MEERLVATYEEAYAVSLDYYSGDDLAAKTFVDKYALRDNEGDFKETTPDDMHHRLAKELARIEAKYPNPLSEDEIYSALKDFKYIVPQGSPMSAIGNPYQIMSLSNCVVVKSPGDSVEEIIETARDMAQLYKRRCVEEGTLVFVQDKGPVPMKGVSVGDRVLSYDTDKKETCYKNVIDKAVTKVSEEDRIVITSSNGTKLKTSKKHPVLTYRDEQLCFVPVIDLTVGDVLVRPSSGAAQIYKPSKDMADIAWFIGAHIGDGICDYVSGKCTKNYPVGKCTYYYPKFRFRISGDNEEVIAEYCRVHNKMVEGGSTYHKSYSKAYSVDVWEYGSACYKNEQILDRFLDRQFGKKVYTAKTPAFIKEHNLWAPYIAGLLDTDGFKRVEGLNFTLSLCAKEIVDDVSAYLTAVGVPIKTTIQEPRLDRPNESVAYKVSISSCQELLDIVRPYLKHTKKIERFESAIDFREWSRKYPLNLSETKDIISRYEKMPWGSRTNNLSAVIGLLKSDKFGAGIGALREFVRFSLLTEEKLTEIRQRVVITSIEADTESQSYYDIEIEGTNNFFAGTLGLVNIHNCGVGTDLSTLRPEGMAVNNAARTTTGAWSFADFYSYVCRMIGQNSRRGALMLTMDVRHPDIEKFAVMKRDKSKVTGANVSIRINDEFMEAVRDDKPFTLRWPVDGVEPKITKEIRARDLWSTIIESVHQGSEPGLLMWDNITRELPANYYAGFECVSTNPCQTAWATVLTPKGVSTIGAIEIGDTIWSGKQWTVVSNKVFTGIKPVYEFKTDVGVFVGTEDHRVVSRGQKIKVGVAESIDAAPFPGEQVDNVTHKITERKYIGEEEVYDITVEADEHTYWTDGLSVGNCSEIPLSEFDACRLTTVNLSGFVQDKFTKEARFDFELFAKVVKVAQRLMDDIVDLEVEAIDKIMSLTGSKGERSLWQKLRDSCLRGRRTGLGTFGLADTLAQLRLAYDSGPGLEMTGSIFEAFRNNAYEESVILAEERGAFSVWDWTIEKDCPFLQRLPKKLLDRMKKTGRRNISLLTNAPTGSVAIVSHNSSSGIEPVFRNFYTRRKKINHDDKAAQVDFIDHLGDKWQEFNVFHRNVADWVRMKDPDWDGSTVPELPKFFTTSDEIDWQKRVKIQSVIQSYLDHAISSTINLPEDVSEETVGALYLKGWELGLKGLTIYREGSRTGVLVSSNGKDSEGRPKKISRNHAPKRPNVLEADVYHGVVQGEPWTIVVGLLDGEPYELFGGPGQEASIPKSVKNGFMTKTKVNKDYNRYDLSFIFGGEEKIVSDIGRLFQNKAYSTFTRALSLAIRHGAPIQHVCEQLQKDPSEDLLSLSAVLRRALKKYVGDDIQTVVKGKTCDKCGSSELKYVEGCPQCIQCGHQKCSG